MIVRKIIWLLFLCLPLLSAAQKRPSNIPVQVKVIVNTQTDNKDLILYSKDRLLAIGDFKAKPDPASHGVGATYSGVLMEMQGLAKRDVMNITVTLTIYFDKTKSWMKKEGKNARVLAHEQLHFDLTAIKACDLAKAIEEEKFTSENVQQRLRELQRQHMQELNEWQLNYDKETRHGTIMEKQAEWAERIERGIANSECI